MNIHDVFCVAGWFVCLERWEDLPCWFREQIIEGRFANMVETTIEEKHSRVTTARRGGFIGPVRISLANRLPMFERWIRRGTLKLPLFLKAFEQTREIVRAPFLFGIETHPLLKGGFRRGKRKSSWSVRNALNKIIYRCDIDSMFQDTRDAAVRDAKKKAAQARKNARFMAQTRRFGMGTFECVQQKALEGHFRVTLDKNKFYSTGAAGMGLKRMSTALTETACKRLRVDEDAAECDGADIVDLDGMVPSIGLDEQIVFRIVQDNPSKKKTVRVPLAGGRKVRSGMIVTLHADGGPTHKRADGSIVVGLNAMASSDSDPHWVFEACADMESLQEHCVKWTSSSACYGIADGTPYDMRSEDVDPIINELMSCNAFHNSESRGLVAHPDQTPVLERMAGHGLVSKSRSTQPTWALTKKGCEQVRTYMQLEKPSKVFVVRRQLALNDLSEYELMILLKEDGWQWQQWLPPSQRPKRLMDKFVPYRLDPLEPKIWYSTAELRSPYMKVLLDAERLFTQGLTEIPHGLHEDCYKRFLACDFRLQLEDAPQDLDAMPSRRSEQLELDDAPQDLDVVPLGLSKEEEEELEDSVLALLEAEANGTAEIPLWILEEAKRDVTPPDSGTATPVGVAGTPPAEPPADALPPDVGDVGDAGDAGGSDIDTHDGGGAADDPDMPLFLVKGHFGVFSIIPKQAATAPPWGGYQATCPFHKKNDKTGCNRFVSLGGSTARHRRQAIQQMLWWCTVAKEYSRQSLHMKHPVPIDALPAPVWLLARTVTEKPPVGTVKSDVELDAAAGIEVVAVVPRGRGRGRAKGAGRGHGKPAMPLGAVADDEATSSSSSSSSSDANTKCTHDSSSSD